MRLIQKLYSIVIVLFLFMTPLCTRVYAANGGDFSYINVIDGNSIKLTNPIYLDTSRAEKVTPRTEVENPYLLRGNFDESDYFSSEITELDFENNKSLSEPSKKNKNNAEELEEKMSTFVDESVTKKDEYIPLREASDFFSPTEEKISDDVKVDVEDFLTPLVTTDDVNKIVESDDSYTAGASSENNIDLEKLEGRMISSIDVVGLNTLSKDIVLSNIGTHAGMLFNIELMQQDLQKIYSIGYFTEDMAVEPSEKPNGTIALTFIVNENILVKNVSVIGNNVISTSELMPLIENMKNLPQNLSEINRGIDRICAHYHDKGYILASVSSIDDNSDGALRFTIQEGVINKVSISGNTKTKNYIIARNIMTRANTVYNEESLKKDLAKIYSTQIFEEVNREIKPSENNSGAFDVTVVVKEKSSNSLSLGGGIDSGIGAFGQVGIKEENFLGRGQKLSLSGTVGTGILMSDASIKNHMNYQAELNFFEPHFLDADNSLMGKLYFRELGSFQVPLAIERRIGIKTGIEHRVLGSDHLTTNFTIGAEHIKLKEGDFNTISGLYNKHGFDIAQRTKQLSGGFFLNLSPGIKYNSLDDKEVPREGIIAQAQFTEAIGLTSVSNTHGRLSGAITRFFPVFKKSSLSFTAKGGMKVHGDDMPEVLAYRLGGPYSVRGYKMSGVGTGESFIMGSAELATPIPLVDRLRWDFFKKMRLTFFIDAGQVFEETISNKLYDRPGNAISVGVGLKLNIPGIGPISVDYGIPLINSGIYGSSGGYFTFGTGGLNGYNW